MSSGKSFLWCVVFICIILVTRANLAYAAANTDDMVGYWKFDETAAGSTAADASGDNNHGTPLNNPAPSTDVPSSSFTNARSLDFNGSNQYVYKSGPTGFNTGANPRTIAGWVKATDTTGVKVPFSYGLCSGGNESRAFGVFLDGTETINFWGCGGADVNTGVKVTPGEWTHLAATYDGAYVRVYKNGVQAGLTTARSLLSIADPNSVQWQVGSASLLDTAGYYYAGGIDDVRVYNRALSATEVAALAAGNHTSATWDGSSSTDTETAANWDINAVPDPYTLITIADVTNDPVVTTNLSLAGLTINAGGNLSLAGFNLTLKDAGAFTNNGTLTLQGGETLSGFTNDTDSGTIVYNGAGTYASGLIAGDTYNHLTFNGTGSWTLSATLDVNGNLTITSGTLATAGNNITLAGNWLNADTFTHGDATVTLDGADQSIAGSTTFYNLTKSVSTARTLTFAAATTQTITNILNLSGQSGALLSLHSSASPTQWKIDPQGTRTLSYLNPQDSNNVNATAIAYDSTFSYGSNLTNWSTPTPTPSPTPAPTPTTAASSTNNDSVSTSEATAPTCTDSKPTGSPDLFQIDTTTDSATLYFAPINGISRYFISYATSSAAEEYGAEVDLSDQGVQSYTIYSLSPDTTYYFKIRGQNGCMTGEWSNIKSVTTQTTNADSSLISTITDTVKKAFVPKKELEIISSELSEKPAEKQEEVANPEEEKIEQQGAELTVVVKDSANNPVSGALVTIHSKVQQATTDENGIAKFENVEPGDHKVILAYNEYEGEQQLTIDESQKELELTLQVEMKKGVSWPIFLLVIGVSLVIIISLLIFTYQQKYFKKSS